ncbi:trimeric intracellular cation channel family protein [Rhodobacteraceae bacterium 2CG4]|uniref:Trimeric intracellular cation channel family protein n=1 Tax=Halovulum marinum TaxID=2662447 RepID=A0A6L5Z126_9RHOB|nr:trimeric intracellular cation channel family protein [Halovulum marinum]MSU90251.1 trimeric intracellular cation channel family protein [Halovulum marinum]
MTAVEILDYSGVALFAATGALAASRKQLDILGFVFLAAVTGTGGGTVRDLVLDVPVFWVAQPFYVLVCAAAAICLFFAAPLAESRYRWLLWLDAAALAAYGVFGAYKGLLVSGSPIVAVVMGTLTGTLGGILRDVLVNEQSVLLRREIYVTAALAGALVYVAAEALGVGPPVSAAGGFAAAFGLRSCALAFDWQLPVYKSLPGRHPDDLPR